MRLILLSTLCAALLPACATNPATGERQLMLVSEGREISLGQQADPEVTLQYGLYPDTVLQAYVRGLGERLAAVSERPNLPWTFRVVDDPIVNAFALPGGFIYVTRGILAYFNSEAELVAVLGHEIGHVTARHSASQMSQQQLAQVGLVAGMVVAPQLQDFAGLAESSLGLLFLKFSRDDERQADDLGLRYLMRTGYDPQEMPKVFAMLASVTEGEGGRLPGWLSTHPDPQDRQQRLARAIAALPSVPGARVVNRNEYLRRLDGMMFGANPREGFFRDRAFLHPELRFRLEFPSGWRTQNQRRAVVGQSQNQDALIELTLANAVTPEAAVQAFLGQGGITSEGLPSRFQTRRGMPAARASFTATSAQGRLLGLVWAVRYNQQVFQIMGVSTEARWPAYASLVEQTLDSFGPLTDSVALVVQPLRLDVVTLDRAMTLQEFSQRYPSQVSLDALARLNQVTPAERLEAGRALKRVVGGPLP
jgi:predicted Zn-dependent protease